MEMRLPPKLATWLLLHLGSGDHLDAIVGDLRERFETYPSRSRYWRQVVLAISVGAAEEVRSHRLIALRAVLTGWLALIGTVWFLGVLTYTLWVVANGGVDVAGYWIVLPTSFYTWVWRYGAFVTLGTNAVAGLLSGWIVGCFNAQRSGPVLLTFAASVLLWLSVDWILIPSSVRALPTIYWLNTVALLLWIMTGGILGSRLHRSASGPRRPVKSWSS